MHIFVTGGSGQTGPAVVSELIANGHTVTGLARSEKSRNRLTQLGAQTLDGSLEDLEALAKGARAAEGVIHMAFGGDFSDPGSSSRQDCAAIGAMGDALAGSGKPLVITSGTLVMTPGKVATEQDPPDPQSLGSLRIPGEQACLALTGKGVRALVVRLSPSVHLLRTRGEPASPPMSTMARTAGPLFIARMQLPSSGLPSKRLPQAARCTVQGRAASPSSPSRTLSAACSTSRPSPSLQTGP